MQGILICSLVREDPTGCGAASAQLVSLISGACEPQPLKPARPEPHASQQEKPPNEKP